MKNKFYALIPLFAVAFLQPAAVLAGLPDLAVSPDIVFSNNSPEPSEPVTITATVNNNGDTYFDYTPFDRHDTLTGSTSDFITLHSTISLAQPFVADSALYLGKVRLLIRNMGNTSTDALTVRILKNNAGKFEPAPTYDSDNVLASQTLVSTFTAFGWQDFTFDTAPYLDAGTTYWIYATNLLPIAQSTSTYQWWVDIGVALNEVHVSQDNGINWKHIAGSSFTAHFEAYQCADTVIACYGGDPDSDGVLIGSRTIHSPIPAGTAQTLSFPWTALASTRVYVTVDRPGDITESLEDNNTAWKQLNIAAVLPVISGQVSPAEGAVAVDIAAPISITFSEDMNTTLTTQALSVKVIKDANGAVPADTAVTGTVDYSARTLTLSAVWKKGYTYQVTISTGAQDLYGSALAAPKVWTFTTIRDRATDNKVIDEASGTAVTLTAGAVSDDYYLVITEPAISGKIQQATAKLRQTNGAFFSPLAGSMREFSLFSSSGAPITGSFPQSALISFKYEASNGFVRDSDGRLVREKTLRLYWLDEDNNLWLKLPDSTVDTETHTVSARVNHFSVYALFGGSDTDLSQAYAYPVPWKPSAGKAETGTLTGGITFTGLGSEATIRLYTLSGELVKILRYEYTGGAEEQKWNGTNEQGEAVASGVYLYRIENNREHVTGKLIIVR